MPNNDRRMVDEGTTIEAILDSHPKTHLLPALQQGMPAGMFDTLIATIERYDSPETTTERIVFRAIAEAALAIDDPHKKFEAKLSSVLYELINGNIYAVFPEC